MTELPAKVCFGFRRPAAGMAHCPVCGWLAPTVNAAGLPDRKVIVLHSIMVITSGMWKLLLPEVQCPGGCFLIPANAWLCWKCQRPCTDPDQWCFDCKACIWCDDIAGCAQVTRKMVRFNAHREISTDDDD